MHDIISAAAASLSVYRSTATAFYSPSHCSYPYRDWDNLQMKDKRPILKMSLVRRLDCTLAHIDCISNLQKIHVESSPCSLLPRVHVADGSHR